MNAEQLSLVWAVIGNRGSGKTLLLTHFGVEKLEHTWMVRRVRGLLHDDTLLPKHKVNVWSNYPIRAVAKMPGHNKLVMLETQPLITEDLMLWKEYIRDGYIIYDEIDQDADRQDWMAQLPKLLVKGIKLMRHRNLSLICSLQFLDELNIRLYKQADIVIRMRDKVFTDWGRENRLRPGEVMQAVFIDKSGMMTGYAYDENHMAYPVDFLGKRYHHNYSTLHEFDVLRPKYRVKQPVREVMTAEEAERQERDNQLFLSTLSYFLYEHPAEWVKSADFKAKLEEHGCGYTPQQMGSRLSTMGVKLRRVGGLPQYDLSGIELEKALA